MIKLIKKYKAFGFGLLIVVPVIFLLELFKQIKLPQDASLEIFIVTSFWWLVVSLLLHQYFNIKRHRKTVAKIVALIVLLFVAIIGDSAMSTSDNPITFILLVVFWIGFVYILVPAFLKKFWKLVALCYAPLFLYYLYIRLFSGGLEAYLKIKEGLSITYIFVPIPIFIGLWIYEQWKWVKALQSEKTKTELSLLKTQINPHFFFNTLNNLYALTIKNSKQAPEVILKLSDMMRYTIYEGKKDWVFLKDEIQYLDNYIELHKIRYHKSVNIQFTNSIETSDQIAPLLFIILLENALKHGVESLMTDAFVKMSLVSNEDEIHFSIENNFDPHELSSEKGIGLENLKHRLSLIYPKRHDFNILEEGNIFKADLKIKKHD